eukprot:160922_1
MNQDEWHLYWQHLIHIMTNPAFSIIHIIIDFVTLFHLTVAKAQYLIALLVLFIIIINFLQCIYFPLCISLPCSLHIAFFHSTVQLLPLALSLTYYDPNDTLLNVLFVIVFISFAVVIFIQSTLDNYHITHDNNTRVTHIFALCIILDYIHFILLLLCQMYTTTNYYYYKCLFQAYPVSIILQICVVVRLIRSWREFDIYVNMFYTFKFVLLWYIMIPIGAECVNASWIILLYNQIFSKLRHSKQLDESVKDSLVEWLNKDKDDLLLKICCLNHVKLLSSRGTGDTALLAYLERDHRNGKQFYGNASWNDIRNNSDKLKTMNLMHAIAGHISKYYTLNKIRNSLIRNWNRFINNRTMDNFIECLEAWFSVFITGWIMGYAILTAFHVFGSPVIVLCVMYGSLNSHQTCFLILYCMILCIVLVKIYKMANYERMMWYVIPDLSRSGCTEEEIQLFRKHYKKIKYEFPQIKEILEDILGNYDIANTILLFVPDDIHIYKCEHNMPL